MMSRILLILSLAAALESPAPSPLLPKQLSALVDAVDKNFASMKDFSADFVQISTILVNQRQEDKGHLYLTKERKMRFDYTAPEEKHFISNGKTLYTYIPRARQVTREQVKESTSDIIPMMFLVGRANLRKEFRDITEVAAKPLFDGDRVLRLLPQRKLEGIQSIDIEVNPRTNLIDRMILLDTDKSATDFIFLNIVVNSNIEAARFEFKPPPGIRVVEGAGIQ